MPSQICKKMEDGKFASWPNELAAGSIGPHGLNFLADRAQVSLGLVFGPKSELSRAETRDGGEEKGNAGHLVLDSPLVELVLGPRKRVNYEVNRRHFRFASH